MTISELLDYLDGRGLVVTDSDLIAEELVDVGLTPDTEITERK
jgi:hypothetical protein